MIGAGEKKYPKKNRLEQKNKPNSSLFKHTLRFINASNGTAPGCIPKEADREADPGSSPET
jgi:hypothetical protein